MKTLYELLGALPDDDAERLRAAFRKVAKATHPDNNPGDPDAAHRFRRIVRAHDILGDEQLRAAYDWLLAGAQQKRYPKRNRFASSIRHLIPNAIAGGVISFVSIGAFLLFEYASGAAVVPTLAGPRSERDEIALSSKPEAPDATKEKAAPGAAAEAASASPPNPNVDVKDAAYYRQRGRLAYRDGDLSLALIDFDQAISLDPNLADAYVDRAIVFRRMGDLKRAFADIARARQIDNLGRSQGSALKPQQASPLSANN